MKKILIVEDNNLERTVLTHFLTNRGYHVDSASSGAEALMLCSQNTPDLVVSDMMMPEMDGIEFCRRLRATLCGERMPFIFLSGKDELEDRYKGLEIGADDYLTKPVKPKELLAKIEVLLGRTNRLHKP